MKVFVDTAAWIALLNTEDDLHSAAKQVRDELQQQKASLVTTDFVLIEVADALCVPSLRQKTITFINRLRQVKNLQIVPVTDWNEDINKKSDNVQLKTIAEIYANLQILFLKFDFVLNQVNQLLPEQIDRVQSYYNLG